MILNNDEVQSRLEDLCDVDGLGKAKKARAVYDSHAVLSAEVAALREALEPFAEFAEAIADDVPDEEAVSIYTHDGKRRVVRYRDYRAARAALSRPALTGNGGKP